MSAVQHQQQQSRQVEVPKDQGLTAQVASPVASLSSNVDPWPHYIMSAACAGSGALAYNNKATTPRGAAVAAAFSAAYFLAGRMLVQGHEKLGYDLGTATSAALTAVAYPMIQGPTSAYAVAMMATGGISTVANFIKSYQARTGKPHEVREVNKK